MRWRSLSLALVAAAAGEPVAAAQADEGPVRWGGLVIVDAWSLLEGGEDVGTSVLVKAKGTLDVDAERAWGWTGVSVHLSGLYTGDEAFSGDRVGDGQTVSNIETGVEVLRPYEVWIERRWEPGAVSVRAGLYDFNTEFDALEHSALFLNSSHGIGADIAQSGENGPLIFPTPGLAVRVQGDPAAGWTVRGVMAEGSPGDASRPERHRLTLSREEGVFAAIEVERRLGTARGAAASICARKARSGRLRMDRARCRPLDGSVSRTIGRTPSTPSSAPAWSSGGWSVIGRTTARGWPSPIRAWAKRPVADARSWGTQPLAAS